jgi:hypothetical protein
MKFLRILACSVFAACALAMFGANELPRLAQLKIRAESGDRVAQYEYGLELRNAERISWFEKSAKQGYAHAQDALAGHYDSMLVTDQKKRAANHRIAARWASRAAYQGFAPAQMKLSTYYARGLGVPKNSAVAYAWAEIAVRTTSKPLGGIVYKSNRDRLILATSSDEIAEGTRMADQFTAGAWSGMNPVEADIIFGQLAVSAIYRMNGVEMPVVNGTRFSPGESKDVMIDGQPVRLKCHKASSKTVVLGIEGTRFEREIGLKH